MSMAYSLTSLQQPQEAKNVQEIEMRVKSCYINGLPGHYQESANDLHYDPTEDNKTKSNIYVTDRETWNNLEPSEIAKIIRHRHVFIRAASHRTDTTFSEKILDRYTSLSQKRQVQGQSMSIFRWSLTDRLIDQGRRTTGDRHATLVVGSLRELVVEVDKGNKGEKSKILNFLDIPCGGGLGEYPPRFECVLFQPLNFSASLTFYKGPIHWSQSLGTNETPARISQRLSLRWGWLAHKCHHPCYILVPCWYRRLHDNRWLPGWNQDMVYSSAPRRYSIRTCIFWAFGNCRWSWWQKLVLWARSTHAWRFVVRSWYISIHFDILISRWLV